MLSYCPFDVFKNPNSSLSALLLGALPTDIGVQALAVLGQCTITTIQQTEGNTHSSVRIHRSGGQGPSII